jgi:hypothetical protein
MEFCAKPCRPACDLSHAGRGVAAVVVSWCVLACAAEPEAANLREERLGPSARSAQRLLEPAAVLPGLDRVALSQCLGAMEQNYGGSEYDSLLMLKCELEGCGGAQQADTLALLAASPHRVVSVLSTFSTVVIDVGTPDQVFLWACRYALDPVFQSAFSEGLPNILLPLE